jgi:hypothetical protein
MLTRARGALGWSRDSSVLLGLFLVTVGLIIYVWWPLAEEYLAQADGSLPWYRYVDWLLLGVFAFMTLTIIARADLRRDSLIALVALAGGLVIESWGTQTNLWYYYTAERPPLWIIPAWPIATLSIDRVTRALNALTDRYAVRFETNRYAVLAQRALYWLAFGAFYLLMLLFVSPTLEKPLSAFALLLTAFIILTPRDHRMSLLIFAAGSGLGYFLERWGTTRECWTYYTLQTPPLFAVLAHGMAAVAFWRAALIVHRLGTRLLRLASL